MADLKTNYKDDVLDTSKNEKRKFRMIQNDDGTVSFEDATEYTQQGDAFSAADINATNAKINEQNRSLTTFETGNINFVGSVDNITGTSGYVVKNGHIAIASFEFSFKTGYPFNGKAKIGTLPFKAKHASYDGFVCNLNNGQIASVFVTGSDIMLQSNNTITENTVLRGGITYFTE